MKLLLILTTILLSACAAESPEPLNDDTGSIVFIDTRFEIVNYINRVTFTIVNRTDKRATDMYCELKAQRNSDVLQEDSRPMFDVLEPGQDKSFDIGFGDIHHSVLVNHVRYSCDLSLDGVGTFLSGGLRWASGMIKNGCITIWHRSDKQHSNEFNHIEIGHDELQIGPISISDDQAKAWSNSTWIGYGGRLTNGVVSYTERSPSAWAT